MDKPSQIIDVWMQHPNSEFLGHPMFESLRRWMGIKEIPDEIPLDITLDAMNQAGVAKALICSWWGPQGQLISNEEVAKAVSAYPERFVGIGSANLYRPMDAVRTIRQCVSDYGFKGIRMVQWFWNLPPTDRRYYPIFVACIENNIPICLQVGHTGPLCPSEPGRPIPYIDEIAIDFPELKIVCGHIGYPWTSEMIAVATKHENVYIDTSAYTASKFPQELVDFMKSNGKRKVLFGTNYPMITPEKCLENLDDLQLDDEVKKAFLFRNAERVFNL